MKEVKLSLCLNNLIWLQGNIHNSFKSSWKVSELKRSQDTMSTHTQNNCISKNEQKIKISSNWQISSVYKQNICTSFMLKSIED